MPLINKSLGRKYGSFVLLVLRVIEISGMMSNEDSPNLNVAPTPAPIDILSRSSSPEVVSSPSTLVGSFASGNDFPKSLKESREIKETGESHKENAIFNFKSDFIENSETNKFSTESSEEQPFSETPAEYKHGPSNFQSQKIPENSFSLQEVRHALNALLKENPENSTSNHADPSETPLNSPHKNPPLPLPITALVSPTYIPCLLPCQSLVGAIELSPIRYSDWLACLFRWVRQEGRLRCSACINSASGLLARCSGCGALWHRQCFCSRLSAACRTEEPPCNGNSKASKALCFSCGFPVAFLRLPSETAAVVRYLSLFSEHIRKTRRSEDRVPLFIASVAHTFSSSKPLLLPFYLDGRRVEIFKNYKAWVENNALLCVNILCNLIRTATDVNVLGYVVGGVCAGVFLKNVGVESQAGMLMELVRHPLSGSGLDGQFLGRKGCGPGDALVGSGGVFMLCCSIIDVICEGGEEVGGLCVVAAPLKEKLQAMNAGELEIGNRVLEYLDVLMCL